MYSTAQLPTTTYKDVVIPSIHENDIQNIFNSSINSPNYIPTLIKDQDINYATIPKDKLREVALDSLSTNKPFPLARYSTPNRYVQGYYDPECETIERRRIEYRASVPYAIINGEKNRYKYPLLTYDCDECDSTNDANDYRYDYCNSAVNNVFNTRDKRMKINDDDKIGILNANTTTDINDLLYNNESIQIKHQPYGTISSKNIPLYPEIYPYITKTVPTIGLSNNVKSRLPAGSNFTTNDLAKNLTEPFNTVQTNNTSFHNKPDSSRTTEHFTEAFINPIERETDYMYLEALKIRALAVCSFLNDHVSYKVWKPNWRLLEKNLKRNKFLFERLDASDADIAYVINKGDEVKFRIRDNKHYVPLNIYQYVLYHEMAHMSTTELQHTPKFHELLNLISLAGFELGFIDLSRTTSEFYLTNGQPISCRMSMVDEISKGCDLLKKANPHSKLYYDSIKHAIKRYL